MSNDMGLIGFAGTREGLTAILDWVAYEEAQLETERKHQAAQSGARLAGDRPLYQLKALRACCEAALLCANGDNQVARPTARAALAAVEAWHEVERLAHAAAEEARRAARHQSEL